MNSQNEMKEMRASNNNDEVNLLQNEEQELINGGDATTNCQKGYSKNWLGTSCECGYKEDVIDVDSPEAIEP